MKIQSAKAGIGTGRAGLQAASGLFSSAGLFDKGVKSFHPNDLDPYLLFDAQSSMIGTLENPTLDLDPSKQDTLDVITATRAGTATFTDFNGNIASAPANTVRVDHVDGVPMILVEPSATNLLPYSEDFSQSAWSKNNVTLSSGFSAPDGSMNASKLEANATDSSLQNTFTVASGTTYSVSFYLKTISGSLETAIALGSPGFPQNEGEGGRYKNITVTDEWQRFTLTSTADANAATGISFGGFSSFSTGEEVYIWGAQLETGIATSYIPTSGGDAAARTRNADDLVITGSAFTDFYNQSEGTIYLEAQKQDAGSIYNFTIGDGTTSNRIPVEGNFVSVTQGGTGQAPTSITLPNNQIYRLAVTLKNNGSKVSVNGGNEVNVASPTLPTSTGIAIGGRQDDGNAQKLNGHIKRLIYWPYHSDNL
jgi:hypothetical protein